MTTWAWDALGRVEQQVLGNQVTASHSYDAAGRQTALGYRRADGSLVSLYTATYDAVGNRTAVAELDGAFAYGYDASNQLIREERTGSEAYHYRYQYDGVGNRLSLHQGTEFIEYAYNAADELTGTQTLVPGESQTVPLAPGTRRTTGWSACKPATRRVAWSAPWPPPPSRSPGRVWCACRCPCRRRRWTRAPRRR